MSQNAAASSATSATASKNTATTQAGNSATSATASAGSATTATTQASNASGSATTAATQATKAQDYATKVNGVVPSTSDFSAKAQAVGGTGVTGATGAASEWAIKATAVDSSGENSAKSYAISGTAISAGSSKQWSLGGGNSFALATPVTGSGGSAEYSARYWADQAASSVANFDEKYYGNYASDALAENAHEAAGKTVTVGDLYYNTTVSAVKYCSVAPSGTGAPVGTWIAIAATDTSAFSTKGFATAMAIAL